MKTGHADDHSLTEHKPGLDRILTPQTFSAKSISYSLMSLGANVP